MHWNIVVFMTYINNFDLNAFVHFNTELNIFFKKV